MQYHLYILVYLDGSHPNFFFRLYW